MHRRDAIAEGILNTRQLLARYLAGFDDTNHTRQAPHLPNHVAWCLGHLALTMHRCAEKIDGKPPVESDFFDSKAAAPGTPRPRDRFDTESVCFGSTPTPDPGRYPSMARCVEVYNNACERVAATVRSADDAALDAHVPWGPTTIPGWAVGQRMIYHNGCHTGQITDLRRALGLKSVLS
jgi:hypothetical protein